MMRPRLTVPDVANLLQVSERTVWSWIHSGLLAYSRYGRLVRIDPDAVEAFDAARRVGGRP